MAKKDINSMRGTIDFLKEQGEILTVEGEVDPIYEIAGIQKAFEGGPGLLFNKIKGYPNVRDVGNLFSRRERIAKLFDVDDHKKLKFKCLEAIRNPIPPKIVSEAPCQEVVITKNIDVNATLPIIKHTEEDGGRVIGGGIVLAMGHPSLGENNLSQNRITFRGKDWGTLWSNLWSFLGGAAWDIVHTGKKLPLTVNICPSPAVMMVGGSAMVHGVLPPKRNELGFAGGLQGSPVEIVKAKTVDAYSIANSEWVIEGYLLPERIWETDEAERINQRYKAPLFPEGWGVLGAARKTNKFQVTAITHRRDKPIFSTPLAHSLEEIPLYFAFREACLYELAERTTPGLVIDLNTLDPIMVHGGVIFQVKKRGAIDEERLRALLTRVVTEPATQLVVAIDEDGDIYNTDAVVWTICTRFNIDKRTIVVGGPTGGVAIDATVSPGPESVRPHHPVDKIDLRKWFSEAQIAKAKSLQSEWARVMAERGW